LQGNNEALTSEALIGHGYSGPRHDERPGKFATWGQAIFGPKPPVENRLPDLAVDFSTEVFSADKADVEHNSIRTPAIGLAYYARIGSSASPMWPLLLSRQEAGSAAVARRSHPADSIR
jgi:hypothetical protein